MYDTLSAMMGALVCIFFIAVIVCLIVISKLLTRNRDNERFIDKLRRENSDLWHQVHAPYLPKKKVDIEDGM
jgi:hypothetical protein